MSIVEFIQKFMNSLSFKCWESLLPCGLITYSCSILVHITLKRRGLKLITCIMNKNTSRSTINDFYKR